MKINTNFLFKFLAFSIIFNGLVICSPIISSASEISFRNVFPIPNGCVLVYGSLSFGGKDFFIEECDSSWKILKVFDIGYIKKIQFVNNNTAWGIVGGSLVKLEYERENFTVTVVKRDDETLYLEDVFFINESNGWTCGKNGLILKTVDGGETWDETKNDSNTFLKYIRFIDNNFGWSIGSEYNKGKFYSAFLKTIDGGQTWEAILLPDSKDFSDFFFSSSFHGCGIVDRDEILCTNDGKSWNSIKLANENREGIFFTNNQKGWIVGTSILKTNDGGRTWTYSLQDKDKESRKFAGLNLDNVYFDNEKVGWAWGLSSVYKTKNKGTCWEKISDKWIPELKQILLRR